VGVATHQVASEDEAEDSTDQLEDDKDDNDHSILHTTEREIKDDNDHGILHITEREINQYTLLPMYSTPFVSVS
jgi:hypothetical protein